MDGMTKTRLSSIDVRILSKELYRRLNSARVEKVYQISGRELKIKLHRTGEESVNLIVAPNFLCISRYIRPAPKEASSFAMQLRKHLSGGFIRDVKQHGFDRILEIITENRGKIHTLIIELFSKGNVILLNSDKKIIGLLEWQRWRHRKLGVGQTYEYPPAGIDTPSIDVEEFNRILSGSERSIAATLATEFGLGGLYAEELCLNSGIEKNQISRDIDEKKRGILFKSLHKLFDRELDVRIIIRGGKMVDIVPFELEIYKGFSQKEQASFNDAIDEYFSVHEFEDKEERVEGRFGERLKRLRGIERRQRDSLNKLRKKSEDYKKAGDLIYQNLQEVESIMDGVRNRKLRTGDRIGRFRVEEIGKDGTINVEVK